MKGFFVLQLQLARINKQGFCVSACQYREYQRRHVESIRLHVFALSGGVTSFTRWQELVGGLHHKHHLSGSLKMSVKPKFKLDTVEGEYTSEKAVSASAHP